MTGDRPRKLLLLSPFSPRLDAPHGGGRVLAHLVRGLAEHHRLALIYLRAPDEPPLEQDLAERCEIVQEVGRSLPGASAGERWRRRGRLLPSLLRGRPMWAADFWVPAFGAVVSRVAAEWQPDVVQVEFHVMAQYLSSLGTRLAPRVLTEHEPGIEAARDHFRRARGYEQLVRRLDLWAWERYERAILQQVDAVVAFTERDRRVLAALRPELRIDQIPLGVEVPANPLNPLGEPPPSVLFAGNYVHTPNADAARWLVEDIFPRVRAIHPSALLCLAGPGLPADVTAHAPDGVIVTGYVPSLVPWLDRAAAVVAPLRLGGGMRVKVLEALAAGKAVVATPLAAEGLAVSHGEQLLLADSSEAFAGALAELIGQPELRLGLGHRAHAWAGASLSWDRTVMAYNMLYESLLQSGTSATGRHANRITTGT
jgi:polysaccharide biosynthesis protein PslH